MTTKIICSILLISMGFIACKKESASKTNGTYERLLGRWNLVKTITNDYYSGADHRDTITWAPGDYIDFRTDGKAYGYNSGSYDTTAYGIVNDTQVWVDDASYVYDIQVLTDTDLRLYRKDIFSPTEYSEGTAIAHR